MKAVTRCTLVVLVLMLAAALAIAQSNASAPAGNYDAAQPLQPAQAVPVSNLPPPPAMNTPAQTVKPQPLPPQPVIVERAAPQPETAQPMAAQEKVPQPVRHPNAQQPMAERAPAAGESYIIGEGDVLAINVWHETELTRTLPVRMDGMITLPLIGDMKAAGQTVDQLSATITTKLKRYLEAPEVTVIVQEPRSQFFTVMGKVLKPGSYPLGQRLSVMDALALAGGFKDFAKVNKIQVVRTHRDGRVERIPFDYKRAVSGDIQHNFQLEQHDLIVVP